MSLKPIKIYLCICSADFGRVFNYFQDLKKKLKIVVIFCIKYVLKL